ncbi:hypothetical protein N8I77_006299 [Diaporthe amygdali]|uniref:Flap structure-specific endonuclease n=1 Tax=Phomopsis amygdali TaxID=1214568 RepID=A0AAD9SGE1_PHOAM|nr:hypothetical protein N8I77_006299 [Diaporthe amygdali]
MGIKGIYKEIGTGKRVSLCKLAIDHLEQTGRPLRLAIDFAIWSFQAQAARGGANPAIRTLFYRLVRLLSLSIVPVLVFDGPNKPVFKRNKRSRGPGDSVSVAMAKRLVKLFGFHIHDAPGEAEAECALLQQQGVVDAVLSEDVDTIMFGCTLTLRNWSSEGTRAAKTPTHVSVYDVHELGQGESGLDREGMVLVALMSGGDYIPEGVPGCGVKVACEAAKAGFGKRLCRIKRSDQEALRKWREDLLRELRTNESKFFRTKHKALTIPEEFPSMEVLRYYTHPVVSQAATIEKLKRELPSKKEVDVIGLRAFTAETFDWVCKIGAVKFIRVLAPGLLNQALMDLSNQQLESDEPDLREQVEAKLVKSINIRRTHFSTDGTPELRISYVPNDVVGVDLDAEEDEVTSTYGRSGLALNSDDEVDGQAEEAEAGPKKVFDPLQPDLVWVPETVAKLGVPLAVEDWEERRRAKQLAKGVRKAPAKKLRKKTTNMPTGALDQYVKSTKPTSQLQKQPELPSILLSSSPPSSSAQPRLRSTSSITAPVAPTEPRQSRALRDKPSKGSKTYKSQEKATTLQPSLDTNPWTIASSQATPKTSRTRTTVSEAIIISSSPLETRHSPIVASPASHKPHRDAIPPQPSFSSIANNSPDIQLHDDSFNAGHSYSSDATAAEASPSPRKHNRPPDDTPRNPAAKRTQRNTGAGKLRSGSPPRRASRAGGAPPNLAQASIKSFGRLSETVGRGNIMPRGKPLPPDSDSDEEFEELSALGSKRRLVGGAQDVPALCSQRSSSSALNLKEHRNPPAPSRSGPGADSTTVLSSSLAMPSSDRNAAVLPPKEKRAMTKVYMSRTSDAGLGYFTEVEVTPEEADRLASSNRAKRPGGYRVWRQSEVSILDLTGED